MFFRNFAVELILNDKNMNKEDFKINWKLRDDGRDYLSL